MNPDCINYVYNSYETNIYLKNFNITGTNIKKSVIF